MELFLELLRWAEGGSCRHTAILRYFGTENPPDACGRCDVCCEFEEDTSQPGQVTLLVRKALSAVARVHGNFGLTMAAKLLHGDRDSKLERCGLQSVSTFGILKDKPSARLVSLLRRCVTAGWVAFSGGDRPRGSANLRVLAPAQAVERCSAHGSGRVKLDPQSERVTERWKRALFQASRATNRSGGTPFGACRDVSRR